MIEDSYYSSQWYNVRLTVNTILPLINKVKLDSTTSLLRTSAQTLLRLVPDVVFLFFTSGLPISL